MLTQIMILNSCGPEPGTTGLLTSRDVIRVMDPYLFSTKGNHVCFIQLIYRHWSEKILVSKMALESLTIIMNMSVMLVAGISSEKFM